MVMTFQAGSGLNAESVFESATEQRGLSWR